MEQQRNVDRIIEYLQAQGFTVSQIADKLGITRANLYSWRGSTNPIRIANLETELRECYPEVLKGMREEESNQAGEKYLRLLEQTNEYLTAENKRLQEINTSLAASVAKISESLTEKGVHVTS